MANPPGRHGKDSETAKVGRLNKASPPQPNKVLHARLTAFQCLLLRLRFLVVQRLLALGRVSGYLNRSAIE